MSSYPMRDQKGDQLLTPANSALMIIDYQPVQVNSVNSMSRSQMVSNIVTVAKMAYGCEG
jgi:nicotinamidase-related amidase